MEPAAQAGVFSPGVKTTAGRVAVAEPAPAVDTGPPGVDVVDGPPPSSMQADARSERSRAARMVCAFIDRNGSREDLRRQRMESTVMLSEAKHLEGWRPFARAKADKPNVGEGLQTLAQNHRRGLKTPTYMPARVPFALRDGSHS